MNISFSAADIIIKELIYLISQKAQNGHAELVSASYQQSDPETSSGWQYCRLRENVWLTMYIIPIIKNKCVYD